ncbi:MAG TPA: thioredoxin [Gemmatimonadaceae bacterium]|nr:thioredoxin [Gemmatimonadaceae bacterium]
MSNPNDVAAHLTVRCQFCQSWNRVSAKRVGDRPKCGTCSTPILLDRPFQLNDETFARTIADTDLPVFVDFYADWCGPCKMMAPFVDQLAAEYLGRALVAKLDTDRSQKTAGTFNIRGIPTSVVFVRGAEVARQTGALPKAGLVALLSKAMAG